VLSHVAFDHTVPILYYPARSEHRVTRRPVHPSTRFPVRRYPRYGTHVTVYHYVTLPTKKKRDNKITRRRVRTTTIRPYTRRSISPRRWIYYYSYPAA
jgi:hypothetical protein